MREARVEEVRRVIERIADGGAIDAEAVASCAAIALVADGADARDDVTGRWRAEAA